MIKKDFKLRRFIFFVINITEQLNVNNNNTNNNLN